MTMTLGELAGSLAPAGVGRIEITGITADSRQVAPGFLFAALPGSQADGAQFIPDALERGAAAVLGPRTLTPGIAGYVPVLRSDDPRHTLSAFAARFHRGQPETVVAVTGTNGKTSVASFVRQIWRRMGLSAASLGTTGISSPFGNEKLAHTTPDPVEMHKALARLAFHGVTHLALEASSHGLDQRRLDGVRIVAGAFTNLTRDHLDYHETFEDYLDAKMVLFEELLEDGAPAVINADIAEADAIKQRCRTRGLKVKTVGAKGSDIRLLDCERDGFAQKLKLRIGGRIHQVKLPLVGEFQAANVVSALGLVMATGGTADEAVEAVQHLVGARGRLEQVARLKSGARVFVDYAHTPDALENALEALKPYAAGKLAVVFGAGGDRDPGKRPEMGAVAARLADAVYVTDDNPRSEDPAEIRRQVLVGCPNGIEIGGRAEAIGQAMAALGPRDILLVAGKGHETGQEIAGEVYPFSDHEVVEALAGEGLVARPAPEPGVNLWSIDELVTATGGVLHGETSAALNGVSIDSRTVATGDIFFAIKGDAMDGHDFAAKALEAGAGVAVVSRVDAAMTKAGAVLEVPDTLKALEALGRASRARSQAGIIAVTGSVGKTTTKDALRLALSDSGKTHAAVKSFNNHWGVPLTLARMPRDAQYGVFEIGMNHAGEITPLVDMVKPHIAIVTQIAESHLGHFASLDEIADAKAEIFSGVVEGGVAIINRDTPYFERLRAAAEGQGIGSIIGFGKHDEAQVRLGSFVAHSNCSCVTADILGESVTFKLGMPGEHVVMNALAVLATVKLCGADLAKGAMALAGMEAPKGRGGRHKLVVGEGWLTLIDESYNANPASMRAALAMLGQTKTGKGGRRIAVLGDMLELGENAQKLHAELAQPVHDAKVDALYTCGGDMRFLHHAVEARVFKMHAETSAELEPAVLKALRAGDVVMVKGSLGSRMGRIVDAVQANYKARSDEDEEGGDAAGGGTNG